MRNIDCITHHRLVNTESDGYQGRVSVTRSGYTCQSWTSQFPNKHENNERYPFTRRWRHNYCRNPDHEPGLWCYTVDGPRWEFCDIRVCDGCDKGGLQLTKLAVPGPILDLGLVKQLSILAFVRNRIKEDRILFVKISFKPRSD